MTEPVTVDVLVDRPYPVIIGTGLLGELARMLDGRHRVAILHQPVLDRRPPRQSEVICPTRESTPTASRSRTPRPARSCPSSASSGKCWAASASAARTPWSASAGARPPTSRDSPPRPGCAASTIVHVPTTLLGMVDAAVGGKTGINTEAGKNLVGAFHQPAAVLVDLATLETLPRNEIVAGMAEIVKAGFIADPVILDLIEADPEAALDPTGEVLPRADPACDRRQGRGGRRRREGIAAARDPQLRPYPGARDRAPRAATTGATAPRCRSGWSSPPNSGRLAGRLDDDTADRHRAILTSLGLPVTYDADALPQLLEYMAGDKKTRGGRAALRGARRAGQAGPTRRARIPSLLAAAYDEVACASDSRSRSDE